MDIPESLAIPSSGTDVDGFPLPHRCEKCSHMVVFASAQKSGGEAYSEGLFKDTSLGNGRTFRLDDDIFDFEKFRTWTCPIYQSISWTHFAKAGRSIPRVRSAILYTKSYALERFPIDTAICEFIHEENDRFSTEYIRFNAFARDDDVSAKFIKGRKAPVDRTSNSFFQITQGWLNPCWKHESCSHSNLSHLPIRTLDVSDGLKIHIAKSNEKAMYAALTYCWGGFQTTTLSKATLPLWTTSMPGQTLPQTIKDAIMVTRTLGIKFLWVDALCVVQDDPVDVDAEVPRMVEIFSGAYFTIAAASATTSREGFLQTRAATGSWAHTFSLPFLDLDGSVGTISFCPIVRNDCNPLTEPIHSRAWTLQEYILSPRIIEYGTKHVRWICKSHRAFAGLQPLWVKNWAFDQVLGGFGPYIHHSLARRKQLTAVLGRTPDPEIDVTWNNLVHVFTKRKLSIAGDRPGAISGVAQSYAKLTGSKYYAGVWDHDPLALLWYKEDSKLRPNQRSNTAHQREPSWSWFSVDGAIEFLPYQPGLCIVGCQIESAVPNAIFGAVITGKITLKARLRQIHAGFESQGTRITLRFENDVDADIFPAHVYWDQTIEGVYAWFRGRDITFWLMEGSRGLISKERLDAVVGLVLVSDTTRKFYRRAGLFVFGRGYNVDEDAELDVGHKARWELFETSASEIFTIY
ncbi:heterokaryon incompatibility protein-domain-containing protein [Tricladium varicosporioides]|nr:heterokaryon incompatibility protein-domain-containing protein [Hymenoscyphus varicosporioides]